ncbi:GAF domain-containing protein [Pseudoduganella umbonata]|uniref:Excisionase family DNA binding protein n=1 Tax=Pseudoduganella umbonata TaxID=864828 RepID=A0A4P8HSI6_9BURK|nr:GAF domain-containing protein [Pseudoduganella umbonata]MBB3220924.1 excisionase family DNA binding protein [Pseudoduganella umbonata]QCP11622.1 GAF domain-containing protein [Pseudoduganella umbonata]
MSNDEDPILTTTAAARLLGVATSTVQMWMESGAIASWKTPGGHRRTHLSAIQGLMESPPGQASATLGQAIEAALSPVSPDEFAPREEPGYPVARDEATRLVALSASGLVDTPAEARFDRIVRLAAHVTGSPIALVSLLTSTRQWFKARVGLEAQETPREWAFCSHAVIDGNPFVVEDAAADPRFRDNPLVQGDPKIRFYAGVPLRDRGGQALGTLCVIDREPRRLRGAELQALIDLADIASEEIAKK